MSTSAINSIEEVRSYLDKRKAHLEELLYGAEFKVLREWDQDRYIGAYMELKRLWDMLPEEEDTPYRRMMEGRLDWGEDEY